MSLPKPVPGLVIQYSYLWRQEFLGGQEEGRKDRPCAIVASVRTESTGEIRVLVLPATHSQPAHPSLAIEIPAVVKKRLDLDNDRSWIVLSEWNEFVWPGPDLRRLPNSDDRSIAYGMLPPSLFAIIRDRFRALAERGASKPVTRT